LVRRIYSCKQLVLTKRLQVLVHPRGTDLGAESTVLGLCPQVIQRKPARVLLPPALHGRVTRTFDSCCRNAIRWRRCCRATRPQ
jgi:hypothetical protein